jgi:AcrR family transcriptional regulator
VTRGRARGALLADVEDKGSPSGSRVTARQRFREVPPPEQILSREREAELTIRQRELLDHLVEVFEEGFADLTMVTLAGRLQCSLRTLYAIASTRDELMLIGVERFLWRIGRSARSVITDEMTALEALRAYLQSVTVSLGAASDAFSRDLAAVPSVNVLIARQNDYVFSVTRALLDLAVENREIPPLDTSALGRVLSGLGWFFTRPHVQPTLGSSAKEAADSVVDVIMRGLQVSSDARNGRVGGS